MRAARSEPVETGQGRRLDEVLVKELTGGDTISARRMREDFWEFSPTHHPGGSASTDPTMVTSISVTTIRATTNSFIADIPPS